LYRESYSSSSELLSNDDISIEYIPKIKEETKGKVKKDTMKKISSKEAERQEGLERARAWHLDRLKSSRNKKK